MRKTLAIISFCCIITFMGCKTKELSPEQQQKTIECTNKIENQDFTFHANSAQPMSGRSVNLNYNYYLKVTKDTIIANLPYYGRSYVAPIDATDIGIDFTSTHFIYSVNKKNDGTYEIKIKPQDINNRQNEGISFLLKISKNGYGTLNALLINRQNISYYGTVD